jgi:hypothetical protein
MAGQPRIHSVSVHARRGLALYPVSQMLLYLDAGVLHAAPSSCGLERGIVGQLAFFAFLVRARNAPPELFPSFPCYSAVYLYSLLNCYQMACLSIRSLALLRVLPPALCCLYTVSALCDPTC